MLDLQQVLDLWVKPALSYFPEGLNTPNRQQFMLGIGCIESGYYWLQQENNGPALGFWQMEEFTFNDCIVNFLNYESIFTPGWNRITGRPATTDPNEVAQMVNFNRIGFNPRFACYMAAIKIYRAPPALPEFNDLLGMAEYWKTYYNTTEGAGTVQEAIDRMAPIQYVTF